MSFWAEIIKATEKVEQVHGTATKVLNSKKQFEAVEDGHRTLANVPETTAVETMSTMDKVSTWWADLPKPVKIGAYVSGGLAGVLIARKLLK